jgi:hypothetical protein
MLATSAVNAPTDDAAAKALKTLATPAQGVSQADVALSMLKSSSDGEAKADARSKAAEQVETAKPYLAGEVLNARA